MEFEELKQIVIESIDEAKTPIDLFQIVINKVYEKGKNDATRCNGMDEWITEKDDVPCDGAICDVIISDTEKGIGLLCTTIKDGKFMLHNMDITDKVLKWHRLPGVIEDSNGIIQWDK